MKPAFVYLVVTLAVVAVSGGRLHAADEIGFLETFALSPDREEALKQLIPGTEDHYYYSALHRQNLGEYDRVEDLLAPWIKRYGRTDGVREIQHRQAMLRYDEDPKGSLAYLGREMNLQFNHRKQLLDEKPDLPTDLDPDLISRETLTKRALANTRNLDQFEDVSLDWVLRDGVDLDDARRRHLLSRLEYPDYENLVSTVAADLRTKESRGFGEFTIHRRLLPEQLDELLGLRPDLIDNTNFVNTYAAKLRPGNDIDWRVDTAARLAYLERLWEFAGRLNPVFNSLKAQVLYQLLQHHREEGEYPRALFMTYLKLPRPVHYMNEKYLALPDNRRFQVDLNFYDGEVTGFPPIGDDEELVRDYLMKFFVSEDGYEAYAPFIRDTYLKPVFAETKIVNGIGDQEKWFAMLSPSAYQALKDRVDLEFAPANAKEFAIEDAVELDLFVKNVRNLIVKVYEINALNYYLDNGREINTDLNLDGLVANEQTSHTYDESPLRRVRQTFRFDGLTGKRGIWIIEFIGNGMSSRAVVRKGRLQYVSRTTSAGHLVTVLNRDNAPAKDAAVWLGGRKFEPDDKGRIVVPFTSEPGRQPIVLTDGDFASLEHLDHEAENYVFTAGFHVDRENLLAGKTTEVAVRPSLSVNGSPVSLAVLEDVKLTIISTDLEGVNTVDEAPDFALSPDKESVYEFRVPERLAQLQFRLDAKVENLGKGTKEDLSASAQFALNGIDRTEFVADLFLTEFKGGCVVELLGKSGEPLADRPVNLTLKHRDFVRPVDVSLRTGSAGRAGLGELKDIVTISAKGADFQEKTWRLPEDRHSYPASVHGKAGEVLLVPFMEPGNRVTRSDVALLEIHGGTPVRDRFDAVKAGDGFLRIEGLEAGDYELRLRRAARTITLRVTGGENVAGYLLSRHRHLEVKNPAPLQISDVEADRNEVRIQLENFDRNARVHITATRFVPDYDLEANLGGFAFTEPFEIRRGTAPAQYISGRDIGEEYRYILERRYATKFPGNMLARPGLILNPWSLRSTETAIDEAAAGQLWMESPPVQPAESRGGAAGGSAAPAGAPSFASLEFLMESAPMSFNLAPDKNGVVTIAREDLGDRQFLSVLAIDPGNSAFRRLALEEPATFVVRDTRLANNIDPERHFTEQKQVSVLGEGKSLTIEDVRSSDFESYDDLSRVYALFSSLSGDATLAEFAFILGWPDSSEEEKREQYSKYACHELNFFLARKDPEFFAKVVQPYLGNKKDKTFLDRYLAGNDLSNYLEPWAHGRLNIVERILLAQRLGGDEPGATSRHVSDLFDLIPPDAEQWNFRFRSALAGRALSAATGGSGALRGAVDNRKLVEDKQALFAYMKKGQEAVAGEPAAESAPAPMAADSFAVAGVMLEEKLARAETPAAADALAAGKAAGPDETRGRRMIRSKNQPEAREGLAQMAEGVDFEGAELDATELRRSQRQWYRKLEATKEWAENNYYKLPIEQQNASLITANAFWRDYAAWDGEGAFYSENLTEATRNFAEMMFALSVLDLPFKAGEHKIEIEEGALTFAAASPVILFHKEIQEAPVSAEKTPILVSQDFFRHGDRFTQAGNEQVEKYVTDEFLAGVLYGCQVVVTNPTSATQKLDLLLQVPEKSIPALGSEYTTSRHVRLDPYGTQKLEYYFYFPMTSGEETFAHYPVHVAKNEKHIAWADPFRFNVVDKLSRIDEASWDYVSQFGSNRDVFAYLGENNVNRLDLDRIAWRAREDDAFLRRVVDLLSSRHVYNSTLWSYGIYHHITPVARQFLMHADDFLGQSGSYIDCELVTIDPVERRSYQHLEYSPLVNARAHRLGRENKILNNYFCEQYLRLMKILSYRRELDAVDRLGVASYLLLQDRVEEGLAWFDEIDAAGLPEKLQYDYLRAFTAMYREDPGAAAGIAAQYASYPVDRWKERFDRVASQVREITGGEVEVIDPEDRAQVQDTLADTEPAFEFEVENKTVTLKYRNLETVTLNYYTMDLEFLFSSNPFVSKDSGQFSYIRPNATESKNLPAGRDTIRFEIPKEFHSGNVLLEIVGAGQKKAQAYYANELNLQLAENYGRLQVRHAESGKALGKVYVKVYARFPGGETRFYKDGYTDLRGKFDYASLNTDEIGEADRLSLLVMSEGHGAVVREVAPPAQ